jgi:hypothetical protein
MPLFWRTLGTSERTRLRTSQSLSSFRHRMTAMHARVRDRVTRPAQQYGTVPPQVGNTSVDLTQGLRIRIT